MYDWQAAVRRHLERKDVALSDAVIEELAAYLEDAWLARPATATPADEDSFARVALERADMVMLPSPVAPPPPAPQPSTGSLLSGLAGELRYSIRLLARVPVFTTAVVTVLALGLAATTVAFDLLHGALVAPLPYSDADRLVMVWEHNLTRNRPRNVINSGNYYTWSERSRSFAGTGAFAPTVANLASAGAEPEEVRGIAVQASVLRLLGTQPIVGRLLVDGDSEPQAPRTVLLTEGLWRRRFGADPSLIGQSITMSGAAVVVVGIVPSSTTIASFTGEYFRPLIITPEARTTFRGRGLMAMAKLGDGVTAAAAQQELSAIFAGIVREQPEFNTGWTVNIVPFREQLTSETAPALWVLFAAVVTVLLVVCANVAALLLVRALGRRHEVAVRLSLGARPAHILRQMALETAMLFLVGGALGAVLAAGLARLVSRSAEEAGVTLVSDGTLGSAAWGFVALITALTACGCGVGPIVSARRALAGALRDGGRGASGRWRLGRWLVAGEVAAAALVLSSAGLLVRSYVALQQVHPGFHADRVLTARVSRLGAAAQTSSGFVDQVLSRLRPLPGVTHAAAAAYVPLDGNPGIASSFLLVDQPTPPAGQRPTAEFRPVTPGYFAALGIPLRAGRDFTSADTGVEGRSRVAIVNDAFVRMYSADSPPISRRLGDALDATREIVGVVGDVHLASLDGDVRPTIYLPFAQLPGSAITFVVRSAADASTLGRAVTAAVRTVDPNQPVSDVRLLDEIVARSLRRPRIASTTLGIFAAWSLILAAVGVYGVVAYSVSQRRAEFGVRLALGASPGAILRLVLGQSMTTVIGGVFVGALLTVPLSSTLRSLLYGVAPGDPVTLAVVAAVLTVSGLIASYLPARLGARVDPVTTLRGE